MALQNTWLTPLQRSYQQIKAKLVTQLLSIQHEGKQLITDVTEGNILILLISMFSAIAEVIHYYIDNMYRESIFGTARRFDSLINHAALVDYHITGATPAYATVTIIRKGDDLPKVVIGTDIIFSDTSGNIWHPVKAALFPEGSTLVKVNLVQEEIEVLSELGKAFKNTEGVYMAEIPATLTGTQKFNSLYSSCNFIIKEEQWTSVKTLAHSSPSDKHFLIEYDLPNNKYNIIFGNGINGAIPSTEDNITEFQYSKTNGSNGNVEAGAINSSTLTGDYTISNEEHSGGGTDGENFYDLKRRVPLSVRTLGVAVTKQDIIDLALQNPSVGQATLEYDYDRKLNLYISPVNGGSSNESLCAQIKNEIQSNAPIVTWLEVKSVKEVFIHLTMEVTGRKSYRASNIKTDIINALRAAYPSTGPIGGSVRISDIYALIDNLPSVDFLVITNFYLHPVFTTLYGTNYPELNSFQLNKAIGTQEYILQFTSNEMYSIIPKTNESYRGQTGSSLSTSYRVFNGQTGSPIRVNFPDGVDFTINIKPGTYNNGDRFSFKVSEPNHNYEATGFNIPVFKDSDLTLTINEII